ncbi:MAG: hypothetical protein LBF87_08820 [Treponema sp.]|nr:hypothetical protein [Treponema sp.]
MAEPAVRQEKSVLMAVSDVPESLSLAVPQDRTLLRLAKLFLEEPDAAYLRYENWACPGLWGFRAGNRPVLPGEQRSKRRGIGK